MNTFRVGDIVRIREKEFLETQRHVLPECLEEMQDFAGMEFKIKHVTPAGWLLLAGANEILKMVADYAWHPSWVEEIINIPDTSLLGINV